MLEQKLKLKLRLRDGVLRKNIVLMSGLFATPIIAGASNFENAVTISLAFSLITFFSVAICRFIPRNIVYTIRVIIYAVISAIVYIPVYMLSVKIMGQYAVDSTQFYLFLLVANPVILSKTETCFFSREYGSMLLEALYYIIGFDLVCLLTGMLRDIAVNSRIGWMSVNTWFEIPALETSFGGFFVIGILAALCRFVYKNKNLNKLN